MFLPTGELTPSQFPVFTIYVQKTCLPSASSCGAAWSFERVMDRGLAAEVRKRGVARSRQDCMEECLAETEFTCRWVVRTKVQVSRCLGKERRLRMCGIRKVY